MKKRGAIIAGAVAAVLGVSGQAAFAFTANSFKFDPDGAGSASAINNTQTFDYNPGNALAVNGQTAINNFVLNSFDGGTRSVLFETYVQAKLGTILNNNSANVTPVGLINGDFELTLVAGFEERVTSFTDLPGVANNATFEATGNGVNFLEIWFDDTPDASDLAGTGFNNGTKILSATIGAGGVSSFTVVGGGQGTALDGFGPDNYGAIDSITGVGSTQLLGEVTFQDSAFFFNNLQTLTFDLLNTFQNLNFTQVNPSGAFVFGPNGAAPVAAGAGLGTTTLSPINGGGAGRDVQFQIDGTQSFEVTSAIPEPMTAGLGLMGLGALALGLRRRR